MYCPLTSAAESGSLPLTSYNYHTWETWVNNVFDVANVLILLFICKSKVFSYDVAKKTIKMFGGNERKFYICTRKQEKSNNEKLQCLFLRLLFLLCRQLWSARPYVELKDWKIEESKYDPLHSNKVKAGYFLEVRGTLIIDNW